MTLQAYTKIFILVIQQYFSTTAARGELAIKQVDVQQFSILLGKASKGRIHATVGARVAAVEQLFSVENS